MANGKNTPSCGECKQSFFVRNPPNSWEAPMHCGLWNADVPVKRYGTLNLFCVNFESRSFEVGTLGVLKSHMKEAVLYAIFYNDLHKPDKLMPVLDLRTREFTDGRAKEVPPLIHEGIKYVAPHFKIAVTPAEWEKCNQNGGFIEAWDINTNQMLWDLVVYKVGYERMRPRHEQDVFVTALEMDGNQLIVTNERQEKYSIDLSTKTVKRV